MLEILEASFIQSAQSIKDSPSLALSEVAFLGRSNVGKSSLINALTNRKHLAKSSSTPGKTQLINYFEVKMREDEELYKLIFVDLPGFGYAKVSKSLFYAWRKNLDEFLQARKSIKLFIHLIDSRQYNMEIDAELGEYLNSFLLPDQRILRFYTKSDKLNQKERAEVLKVDKEAIFVSSLNKKGIEKARKIILDNVLGR